MRTRDSAWMRRGVVLLLVLVMCACRGEPDAAPSVMAPVEQGQGRVEWRGMQPCADCEGIDTQLTLARSGGARSFVLTETYLAERPVRFVASGNWSREGDLLQLVAQDGARLGYAVLGDGRLQPRDARGRRLATSDGDGVLTPAPVTADR